MDLNRKDKDRIISALLCQKQDFDDYISETLGIESEYIKRMVKTKKKRIEHILELILKMDRGV